MMSSQTIVIIDEDYGRSKVNNSVTKEIAVFLSARGHLISNLFLLQETRPTYVYEQSLRVLKEDHLMILILSKPTVLSFFLAQQSLKTNHRVVFFSQNENLFNDLKAITHPLLYVYNVSKTSQIIETLRLFQL